MPLWPPEETFVDEGGAIVRVTADVLARKVLEVAGGVEAVRGPQGIDGRTGPQGVQGTQGRTGADGRNAYDVAIANGFSGTVNDWLASLVGPQGPQGPTGARGADGAAGRDGAALIDTSLLADGQSVTWDDRADRFVPANVLSAPTGADGDLLVRSGTRWAALAIGGQQQELVVRSDGTIGWVDTPVLNLAAWGARGDNSTNDFTAVKAAFDWACTNGGGIIDGGGWGRIYRMAPASADSLRLPANLTGRVVLRNVAFRLTSTCTTLVTNASGPAATDTFRNLTIAGCRVDANNTTANFQGVLCQIVPTKANVSEIDLLFNEVTNVGTLSGTNNRRCIYIGVLRNEQFDATIQNTVDRIRVIGNKLGITGGGGNTGVFIAGFCNPGAGTAAQYAAATVPLVNAIFDEITVEGNVWTSGTSGPDGFFTSAGVQIGGDAECIKVRCRNNRVYGAGDVGFEYDTVRDLLAEGNYAENCWTSGHFIANNNAGNINFRQQRAVHRDCRAVRSRDRNATMSGFSAQATRGTRFGHLTWENCTFVQTSPNWLSGTGTFLNPTEPPFRIAGPFLWATYRNCRALYDNIALDQLANNQTSTPAGIGIGSHGYESVLEVDGFDFVFNGRGDATHTGGVLQVQPISIGGSRLHVDIKGVRVGTAFTKQLTSYSIRDIAISATGGSGLSDNWSTSGTYDSDYIVDTGDPTDLAQNTRTGLTSVANPTAVKRARVVQMRQTTSINHQVGKCLDGSIYASAVVPTEGPAGLRLEARLRIDETTGDELRTVLADDGTSTTVWQEIVTAGVPVVQGTPTTVTRLTAGQTVGLRAKLNKNTWTSDYFTTGAVPGSITTAGATTLTTTFTLAADMAKWGEAGPGGWVGWGWAPGTNTGLLKTLQYVRMLVLSGSVDNVIAKGDRGATTPGSHYGLYINSTVAQGTRFESPLLLRGWDRHRLAGNTSVDDVFQVTADSAQKSAISMTGCALALPPAAARATVPASGSAYTNTAMCAIDIYSTGGTYTGSMLEISRDGGTTFTSIMAASGEKTVRLQPGDQLRPTYSSAPTWQQVPAHG